MNIKIIVDKTVSHKEPATSHKKPETIIKSDTYVQLYDIPLKPKENHDSTDRSSTKS